MPAHTPRKKPLPETATREPRTGPKRAIRAILEPLRDDHTHRLPEPGVGVPARYCLCVSAQSFTAFNVFSTCFSGDRLVYS
ncbi:hypothetical protein LMG28140_00139 [Paraburkholderia metrosideri]|uniref:Uncharacterized protein n=1 Tax=Paraburkholderia metrosideri TaxID=580937 RepID=A0ABM8N8N5_9BURK|nr:hypothetical protein LMG28140_00139 [Paraburkholderia metrosideri]